MAERERDGSEQDESTVNQVLNKIAEAAGLGSSESDVGEPDSQGTAADVSTSEAAGGAAGGMARGTGRGARLDENDSKNGGAFTGGALNG